MSTEYETHNISGFNIIRPKGRIDMSSVKYFQDSCSLLLNDAKDGLILDFKETRYISSAGIRVLITQLKESKNQNKRIVFCSVGGSVQKVLDTSGLSDFLEIHDDLNKVILALKLQD